MQLFLILVYRGNIIFTSLSKVRGRRRTAESEEGEPMKLQKTMFCDLCYTEPQPHNHDPDTCPNIVCRLCRVQGHGAFTKQCPSVRDSLIKWVPHILFLLHWLIINLYDLYSDILSFYVWMTLIFVKESHWVNYWVDPDLWTILMF